MDSSIAKKSGLRAPVAVSLAVSAMLLSAAEPRAQEAADGPGTALDRYLTLTSAYRGGDHSGSCRALSAWSQEQVMDVLAPVLTPRAAGAEDAELDDPTLVAAALLHTELALTRLGRLGPIQARFHRSGRVDAARTHLRRVLQGPGSERTAYLGHLFLGQTFERAGDLETSVAEYRSAVAALPRGQAGRLALAHALRQAGDRAGERETLGGPIGEESPPPDPFDPWWVYAARPAVCSGDLWGDLRRDAFS